MQPAERVTLCRQVNLIISFDIQNAAVVSLISSQPTGYLFSQEGIVLFNFCIIILLHIAAISVVHFALQIVRFF